MPIPFLLLGGAIASGIAGIVKGVEATSKNAQAKEILEEAETFFETNKDLLETQRQTTHKKLEDYGKLKIKIWDEQFSRFLELYQNFKDVKFEGQVGLDNELKDSLTPETLKEMETLSITAGEIVTGGLGALGTGALAGVASYGGAMMFASASTGTAIASLSGVAATNATLAWFGGGSLAAGGLGMAGGAAVLGGLIAGPIIAVGGFFMAAKANENLEHAKSKSKEVDVAVEQMKNASSLLKQIESLTDQYQSWVIRTNEKLTTLMNQLELRVFELKQKLTTKSTLLNRIKDFLLHLFKQKTNKIDYKTLSIQDKELLHTNIIAVQLMKTLLEKPLMTEEGKIQSSSTKFIDALPNNQKILEIL